MRIILLACGLLLGACGGDGSTRVCFGSIEFCEGAFGRNQRPEARARADAEVFAGELVQLDGSGSSDPDGRITSHSWTQEGGPTVALTGSSLALAEFTAPDVTSETLLDFRLVVTDDDDASDSDQVRITVRPTTASLLATGVELLKTVHPAESGAAGAYCPDCWSYRGLWLGARARAAAAGAEPDVNSLLDELRLLTLLQQAPPASLDGVERRLFELGQREVAWFTAARDPATAELAGRLAGAVARPSAEDWRNALAALDTDPGRSAAAPAYQHAMDTLRRARDRSDSAFPTPGTPTAEAIAAATLLLTLPPL